MKNQHITKEEWLSFFADYPMQKDLQLNDKILAHVEVCEECRELYTSAAELYKAAREYAAVAGPFTNVSGDAGAYRAVAAYGEVSDLPDAAGSVKIDIDFNGSMGSFDADTLELEGTAYRYLFSVEENGKQLNEQYGEAGIQLEGNLLTITVADSLVGKVHAYLRVYEDLQDVTFEGTHGQCILQQDDIYQLIIHFDE